MKKKVIVIAVIAAAALAIGIIAISIIAPRFNAERLPQQELFVDTVTSESAGEETTADDSDKYDTLPYYYHFMDLEEPVMFDVTGDGIEDECYNNTWGSGMVRTQLIVFDGAIDESYVLDGYNYNYIIDGVEDSRLVIIEIGPYGYGDPLVKTRGTVVFQNDGLVFVADDNTIKEDVTAIFEGAEDKKITAEDYVFEYGEHTYSINSAWQDYVNDLGYPELYEENNYGYIGTNYAGYWWALTYQMDRDIFWDFSVTLVSPSGEREGPDTVISHITLGQVPTARGIRCNDSAEALFDTYGTPDRIEYLTAFNPDLVEVIYEGPSGEIVFVVNSELVIQYTILREDKRG